MKFNIRKNPLRAVKNYMGGQSFALTPEMELYTAAATSFVDNSYYEKAGKRIQRIRTLVSKCDPVFVAKLAVYCREQMHLRSIPMVLVIELARVHKGDSLVSKTIERVIQRADELTEILAYYQMAGARSGSKKLNRLSKQVQKGIAAAFNKFDEYQFAKYNRKNAVQLKDALFLSHPKAKNTAQQAVFDKIAAGNLSVPFTWEVELSRIGQENFLTEKERQLAIENKWEELVLSGKMGYMALLRNLRNLIQKGSAKALHKALEIITDPQRIARSRQLPFRFLSAYGEIQKIEADQGLFELDRNRVKESLDGLELAAGASVQNIPLVEGRTLILTDNSGSMRGDYAGKSAVSAISKRSTADIANLFSVLYWTRCENTHIGLFGDRLISPELNRSKGIFENFEVIDRAAAKCGPGTERGIFEMMAQLIGKKIMVDRILIFSDCQVGTGCAWFDRKGNNGQSFNKLFKEYRKLNPEVTTYSIDLKGYGNTLFSDGVMTVAGWSDKIFDLIQALEKGGSAVDEINTIQL